MFTEVPQKKKKRAASTQLHDAGYKNEVPNRPTIDSIESRPQIRINSVLFLKMNLFKKKNHQPSKLKPHKQNKNLNSSSELHDFEEPNQKT
jgi:hypothetical protein